MCQLRWNACIYKVQDRVQSWIENLRNVHDMIHDGPAMTSLDEKMEKSHSSSKKFDSWQSCYIL